MAPGLDVRIAGYDHNQNDGYFQNLAGGKSEGTVEHEYYLEGQVDWKPSDQFEFWARGFISGWNNRGDAGSRVGFANGSFDETNLTDANAYVGGGLFVNPNFGYSAITGGNPEAAAAVAAHGPRYPAAQRHPAQRRRPQQSGDEQSVPSSSRRSSAT